MGNVSYTRRRAQWCADASGALPENLVTVAKGHFAARTTFREIPGSPSPGVFASVPAPLEGMVASISIRLLNATPTGEAMLTIVSPEVDVTGAFMYTFLEGITPATVGPPMYRKAASCSAYYNIDIVDTPHMIHIMIVGGTNLAGVAADVALTVRAH